MHSTDAAPDAPRGPATPPLAPDASIGALGAEQALEVSEARYRALAENASVGIWHLGADGSTIYANPAMGRMLGIDDVDSLEDTGFEQFFTESSLAVVRAEQMRRRAGEPSTYEVTMRTLDGREIPVEISGAPVADADGNLESMIGICVDLSERKRAEAERRELELQVQQARRQESLVRLAGGIAHDFNNLQTAILGNTSLVRQRLAPDSNESALLAEVEAAARRAAQLTSRMLAYAGKGRYEMAPVDLGRLVEDMRDLLDAASSAPIAYDVEAGVPPIDGDRGQMRQMLLEVVTNAWEACAGNDGSVEVNLSSKGSSSDDGDSAPCVELEVADTGCGIAAEPRESIFDPFYSDRQAGRGLGLAAVLGIARGHGGTIRAEDRPGGGTVIRIRLPVSTDAAVSPPDGPAQVLVVDDEASVRDVIAQSLEVVGHTVHQAADGAAALAVMEERGHEIDLVILDLTMAGLSGAETLLRLRARLPDLPVLLVSAYAREDPDSTYPEDATGCAFLHKPFLPADVRAQVATMLAGTV